VRDLTLPHRTLVTRDDHRRAGLPARTRHVGTGEGDEDGLRHVSLYLNAPSVEAVYDAAEKLRMRPEVASVRVVGPDSHAA